MNSTRKKDITRPGNDPRLRGAFVGGCYDRERGITDGNAYHDFDLGVAYALGWHWNQADKREFLDQAAVAGLTAEMAIGWAKEAETLRG
jgi:hypothetical protein